MTNFCEQTRGWPPIEKSKDRKIEEEKKRLRFEAIRVDKARRLVRQKWEKEKETR